MLAFCGPWSWPKISPGALLPLTEVANYLDCMHESAPQPHDGVGIADGGTGCERAGRVDWIKRAPAARAMNPSVDCDGLAALISELEAGLRTRTFSNHHSVQASTRGTTDLRRSRFSGLIVGVRTEWLIGVPSVSLTIGEPSAPIRQGGWVERFRHTVLLPGFCGGTGVTSEPGTRPDLRSGRRR